MNWFGRVWIGALRAAPLRLWVLFAAGPVLTLCAAALTYLIWRGGWQAQWQGKQLDFIGAALMITLALIGVIVVTMARVKVKASGPLGTNFEADPTDSDEVDSK